MRVGVAAVALVGNDRRCATPGKPVTECGTIISFIGQQFFGRRQGFKKGHGGFTIETLPATQKKTYRTALAVNHRVDFGRAAAPTDAERLILTPFLPRAERCAFMAVLSMAFS